MAAAVALSVAPQLDAQSLSGEITVERTITPAERPANRLGSVSPGITLEPVSQKPLKAAPYNGVGTLSRSLTRLEPASYADTFAVDPWRGYVSAGYFPSLNLGVEAGYDLIATRNTRLGTYLNYSGNSYKVPARYGDGEKRPSVAAHSFTVGAALSATVAEKRRLDAEARYTFSSVTMPWRQHEIDGEANDVNLRVAYSDKHSQLPWKAAVRFGHFGFRHDTPADIAFVYGAPETTKLKPAGESVLGIDGALAWREDNHSWRLDLGTELQWLNRLARIWPIAVPSQLTGDHVVADSYWNEGAKLLSVTSLTPSYNLVRDKFTAHLGVRVDLSTGPRGNKFRVAPDIDLAWTPSGRVALGIRLGGGEKLNTLAGLNALSPWLVPAFSYERSNLPLVFDADLSFGPFAGVTIRPFGGFALADSWLMPATVMSSGINQYQYQDLHGGHYGLELSYAYGSLVRATASVEGASASDSDAESGYYLWRDRARWQAVVKVETRPIEPLRVELGLRYRGDRKSYLLKAANYENLSWYENDGTVDLGDICNLSLSASWRFSPALSVFVNVDNMLCRRYELVAGVPSQRLGGLVGVTYKF